MHERKKKTFLPRSKGNSTHSSIEDIPENTTKKPLIAKIKSGVKLHVTNSEKDGNSQNLYHVIFLQLNLFLELVEGLNRAMRSRLEDQRGTEINFELPDFLKDKENEQKNNNSRKIRRTENCNSFDTGNRLNESAIIPHSEWKLPSSTAKSLKLELQSNYENRDIITCNNNTGNLFVPLLYFRVPIYLLFQWKFHRKKYKVQV